MRRWLGVAGRSLCDAPRSCTEGERPLAGAVFFRRDGPFQDQLDTARARRKLACCASSPEAASAGAPVCHASNAARPQLARRTAVMCLTGDASCWGSVPLHNISRPEPAWHGTRAQQACVLRLLPSDSQRRHVRAGCTRLWLGIGCCNWHVAPRSCTEGERPPAGVVSFCRARTVHNQRGTTRVRSKLVC